MRFHAATVLLFLLQCEVVVLAFSGAFFQHRDGTSSLIKSIPSKSSICRRFGDDPFNSNDLHTISNEHNFGIQRSERINKISLSVLRMSSMSNNDNADDNMEDDDNDEDDDDDDDLTENPLARDVDSVSWMESLSQQEANRETISSLRTGAQVLPFFPLGGSVDIPTSEKELTIFEPRYRKMYDDILMNGSNCFVVAMAHPKEEGKYASYGVIYKVVKLRDVSEETDNQYKYVCNHRVVGRVKLHRVLNPETWATGETYLKIEGTIVEEVEFEEEEDIDDENNEDENSGTAAISSVIGKIAAMASPPVKESAAAGSASKEEEELVKSFGDMVNLMHLLEEDVRFTKASMNSLGVSPGSGEDSLWTTIRLWQSYIQQRVNARSGELQREFQRNMLKFLVEEKNFKESELPSAIGFTDLSPELQKEAQALQKRMTVELQPLVVEASLAMQKILEGEDHLARVNLMRYFVDAERKRLSVRKMLRDMYPKTSEEVAPPSENLSREEQAKRTKKIVLEKRIEEKKNLNKPIGKKNLEGLKLPEWDKGSDNTDTDSFYDDDAFQ